MTREEILLVEVDDSSNQKAKVQSIIEVDIEIINEKIQLLKTNITKAKRVVKDKLKSLKAIDENIVQVDYFKVQHDMATLKLWEDFKAEYFPEITEASNVKTIIQG